MIHSFNELLCAAKGSGKRIAAAVAEDKEVLIALFEAKKLDIATAILVGDSEKISQIASENNIPLDGFEIIHETDKAEACRIATKLVKDGAADVVMKGIVDTAVILKAVLDKEQGLRDAPVLSHVAVFDVDGFDRLLYVTDAAMNLAPDCSAKAKIIDNAVRVAHALGNENPIVAALCAVEKVNPKMQATLDAAELVEMNARGEISGCRVMGPLALDNAISPEAAVHKGITDPLAGHADILLVPVIEAGNILYKSLTYMSRAKNAGVIVGAKAPVVVTSRADSDETKLYSIALAITMANRR